MAPRQVELVHADGCGGDDFDVGAGQQRGVAARARAYHHGACVAHKLGREAELVNVHNAEKGFQTPVDEGYVGVYYDKRFLVHKAKQKRMM